MSNPLSPYLLGITIDTTGIANTQVVATNLSTGDNLIASTDSNKVVIFNAADFTNDYTNGDIIQFENTGASKGGNSITIDTTKGFQEATLVCHVASTTQMVI